jgi:hypothetical protein
MAIAVAASELHQTLQSVKWNTSPPAPLVIIQNVKEQKKLEPAVGLYRENAR